MGVLDFLNTIRAFAVHAYKTERHVFQNMALFVITAVAIRGVFFATGGIAQLERLRLVPPGEG